MKMRSAATRESERRSAWRDGRRWRIFPLAPSGAGGRRHACRSHRLRAILKISGSATLSAVVLDIQR